jgi:hypothetical protein
MVKLGDFQVGQAWIITNQAKRVAKILSIGQAEIEVIASESGRPPTKETRGTVTALVCTPAKPVPGYITTEEADQGMAHRLWCKEDFNYDMWTETWIDTARNPVILTGRPRVLEKTWEWVLKVHRVEGRAARHEQLGAPGRLLGTMIDGVLIPETDVHPQLFDELGINEKTQAELEMAAHDRQVIENHERSRAAKVQEDRKGDCADNTAWGPVTKLKMQAGICGIEVHDSKDGIYNTKLRIALSTHLKQIGVNPWDVCGMSREPFQEAVDIARQKMEI